MYRYTSVVYVMYTGSRSSLTSRGETNTYELCDWRERDSVARHELFVSMAGECKPYDAAWGCES